MPTISICSENPGVRQHWMSAVGQPCQEYESVGDLLAASEKVSGGIVLLHMQGTGSSTQRVSDLLASDLGEVKAIVLSDTPNDDEGIQLLRVGVVGYCNTYTAPELARKAIEVVELGDVWVGRKLIERLISDLAFARGATNTATADRLSELTEREREIAALVGEGASNKVIASRLDITERTVKAHLGSVFRKTETKDRLQLALLVNQKQQSSVVS